MRTEYKRDVNHNYLILYGEQDIDTASYQVRMLAANVLPSILKCRMQRVDGNVMFYYEITSRQSISSLYEDKKFKMEDLQLIFRGFVQTLEEMGEYLLNPGQLVIDPEHVFLDVEKKGLYFCYLPGYEKEVQEQFRSFTEYILPKLDHEDARAVMLGYGVYRSALEDGFHLEHLKKELYQVRDGVFQGIGEQDVLAHEDKEADFEENPLTVSGLSKGEENFYQEYAKEGDTCKENRRKGKGICKNAHKECGGKENSYEKNRIEKNIENDRIWEETDSKSRTEQENQGFREYLPVILFAAAAAVIMLGLLTANYLGYLPWLNVELTLGIGLCVLGIGLLGYFILRKKKAKEQKNWRKEVEKNRKVRERQERLLDEFPASTDEKKLEGRTPVKETENWEQVGFGAENGGDTGKDTGAFAPGRVVQNAESFGETVVLSANVLSGPASLVSREPGELATIYLSKELTIVGKLETACDAVISLPTVSRVHGKIRKRGEEYYLSDLNSRNGTSVNGRMLKGDEEYLLQNEDEVDFAQARYVFLK